MSLLEVKDLKTSFFTDAGEVKAVNGVSFFLDNGKVLGIVGESGSGKSVTAYSIMNILAPTGKIVSGSIKYNGTELVGASEKVMKNIRGNKISIIFQDPMTSLNPTYTIGRQLVEAITLHTDRNKAEAKERAIEMLKLVNVNEPEKREINNPCEIFLGGCGKGLLIAMALACEPDILIADRTDNRARRYHSGSDSRPYDEASKGNGNGNNNDNPRPRRYRKDVRRSNSHVRGRHLPNKAPPTKYSTIRAMPTRKGF